MYLVGDIFRKMLFLDSGKGKNGVKDNMRVGLGILRADVNGAIFLLRAMVFPIE